MTALDKALTAYHGEFLISPCPLELSFNYCSHKCGYCFANLNRPDRRADIKALMRFLADFQNRDTLEAHLLRKRYPVLISNRVDPFAASNYKQAVPVIQTLTEMEVPVSIQTKGGQGLKEVLEFLPPSVFYVSISMMDDALRARIEPGAPSIPDRLAMIENLTARGHKVLLGLNPLVSEWITAPEVAALLTIIKGAGVSGVWVQNLHFNYTQTRNLTTSERAAMGEDVIKRSTSKGAESDHAYIDRVLCMVKSEGLEPYCAGYAGESYFFRPFRELYERTFPTIQDWINGCFQHDREIEMMDADEITDAFMTMLPQGEYNLSSYIGSVAHQIFRTHELPNRMTFRTLLEIIWADHRMPQHPARFRSFARAAVAGVNEVIELQDDRGLPYIVFSKTGFSDYYAPYDEARGLTL